MRQETFELGVEFLQKEIERVKALQASILVLHPGSHVKAGEEAGIAKDCRRIGFGNGTCR